MFDVIGQVILRGILTFAWRVILYPAALVLCTPFIVIRALILVFRHRQRFVYALSDGYASVSDAWWAY
jgi:hypothetical protein